jgi:hypothetical protein
VDPAGADRVGDLDGDVSDAGIDLEVGPLVERTGALGDEEGGRLHGDRLGEQRDDHGSEQHRS